jgi:DNA polymerase-3 subunit alpha
MAALGAILRPGCMRAKDYVLICKDCNGKFKIQEDDNAEENKEDDYCPECGSQNVKRVGTSMTDHYCKRKNHEEELENYHPTIDPILATTYNVLAYQEQSMKIAQACAGFDLKEADMLRKAIGKKLPEEMAKVKIMFMEKSKAAGIVSEEQAKEIFGWIEKSQRYSFNKSHAASYGETGYACAYAKTHFPLAFYTNWLKLEKDPDEIPLLVNDARIISSIKIRTPDIRFLKDRVHSDGENIYFGLQDIKGVGESQIKKLRDKLLELNIDKQKLSSLSWMQFLFEISDHLSSTVVLAFIRSGALSYMKIDRMKMAKDYEIWNALTKKEKDFVKANSSNFSDIVGMLTYILKNKGYHNEKRGKFLKDTLDGLTNSPYNIEDNIDYLVYSEEELLGVALTCHITDNITGAMETCSCKDIVKGYKGYSVLKVMLDEVRTWTCKRGESEGKNMAFIKASDSSCQLDNIVVFPKIYEQYSYILSQGNIVYLSGKVGQQGSFQVERVYEHTET